MRAQHFCLASVYIFEWKLNITKYKVFIVDIKKQFRKNYLRQPSIDFDFCNILHANFYQLPDGRISISSLGRPNCVLHAHVAVEFSVLAIRSTSGSFNATLMNLSVFAAHHSWAPMFTRGCFGGVHVGHLLSFCLCFDVVFFVGLFWSGFLCAHCCQCLKIVNSWLSIRFSLTFI